jgi:hypothetical protein
VADLQERVELGQREAEEASERLATQERANRIQQVLIDKQRTELNDLRNT